MGVANDVDTWSLNNVKPGMVAFGQMLFAFAIGDYRTRTNFQDSNGFAIRKRGQPRKYFLMPANFRPPDVGRREVPIEIRRCSYDKPVKSCLLICVLIEFVRH